MTTIAIDGMNEEEFRRSIESRMRHGLADKAIEQLRALLAPFAGPDKILPGRFLTVTADDLSFNGWDALGDSLKRHDRPGRPVTALSIAFGWPGEDVPEPDAEGRLSPLIETGYYTDDAFPFSASAREDLLEGYSYHGCTWTGDCEATDTALWLSGIDDLHGALAMLEARLLASDEPDQDGIRAGSLGACLLSALLYQAVDARVAKGELPRPLCVMSGSSGVYPYFDAPVAGFPEDARKAAEAAEDEIVIDAGVPAPRYSSLLVTGIPRAQKRAVLVLAETADEEAVRIARLRGLSQGESIAEPARPEAVPEVPTPPLADTVIAAVPASPLLVKKPSGQSWDFREMLSPYEPQANLDEAEPLELEQEWDEAESIEPEQDWGSDAPSEPEPELGGTEPNEPEQDWSMAAPLEPVEEPWPVLSGGESPVGPGFSLLDALREDRTQTIFPLPAFHTVADVPEPEPVLPAAEELAEEPELGLSVAVEPDEQPEPALPVAAESVPPAWPLDPAWLHEVEARILPKTPQSELAVKETAGTTKAEAKGMWARILDWWYGRR